MMKHESKTVHAEAGTSFAGSLVTIFAGQGARAAESKTTREHLPGRSRVGRILLNDNNSQDRLLDMKLADIHQMRRKTETFISHQQKIFVAKMEKRQNTWVREHTRFSNSTNLVKPPGEVWEEQAPPPTRGTVVSLGVERKDGDRDGQPGKDGGDKSKDVTYLTEASAENTPRDGPDNGTSVFAKEPDPYERAPRLFVGLPPITHARKSGFQPSGNIDEMFDDKAMKKSLRKTWPPVKEVEGGPEDSTHLPAIDANDPTAAAVAAGVGTESRLSAILLDEEADQDSERSPTPVLVLSRSLPRIHVQEPQTRKLQARRERQPKVRRKRSRRSVDSMDQANPLADDRFVKLHELLASEAVTDHESRELSAIARGMLAAKKFGRRVQDK